MKEEDPVAWSTPEGDDVVIQHAIREAKPVYVLQTVRGAGQILHRTREAAVAQAVAFAKQNHVCVWIANGDHEYTLLEDFRHAEQV